MNTERATPQSRKLGQRVRKAREAKGLGLRALAEQAGINFGTLSKLESGYIARPDAKILQRISKALAIPLEELYEPAGYIRAEGLPPFPVYLRSKYKLSEAETAELEAVFERLSKRRRGKGGGRGKPSL